MRVPREWHFVTRSLDRRPVVLLAGRGAGTDHPSAAANIAALVQVAAERPGCRNLNAAEDAYLAPRESASNLRVIRVVE